MTTQQIQPAQEIDQINRKLECCINELRKQPNIAPSTMAVLQQFHTKVQEARSKVTDQSSIPCVATELEQAADSSLAALKADPAAPQQCVACASELEKCLNTWKSQFMQQKTGWLGGQQGMGSGAGLTGSGTGQQQGGGGPSIMQKIGEKIFGSDQGAGMGMGQPGGGGVGQTGTTGFGAGQRTQAGM